MTGFPNMFSFGIGKAGTKGDEPSLPNAAQAGVSLNFPSIYSMQARFATGIIAQAVKKGVKTIEVTPEAEDAWTDECIATNRDDPVFRTECTPGVGLLCVLCL